MPSTSSPTTEASVSEVLSAMDAATRSGSDAIDELRRRAGAAGAAPSTPSEPEMPIATPNLSADSRTYLRPNGDEYHVRKLGEHDDVAVMRTAHEKNVNALLYGPPGTGKTALVEAAFNDPSVADPFYSVQGTGDTVVADFVGGYVQTPGGIYKWIDGPLPRAMAEGKPLFIDEIALIEPKVMAVVYGAMDGRGVLEVPQNPDREAVHAIKGFYVAGACNPNAPGARMSEALLSRFPLQFYVGTDMKLAKELGVPHQVITTAANLAKKQDEGVITWAPQLREMLDYVRIEREFGTDFALRNMISAAPEMDRGVVGDVISRAYGSQLRPLSLK